MINYIKKLCNLEPVDVDIVATFADKLDVTWMAALRLIIRDWANRTLPQDERDHLAALEVCQRRGDVVGAAYCKGRIDEQETK